MGIWLFENGYHGLVAQAYGAENNTEVKLILYRVLVVALGVSLLLIVLQLPIIKLALLLVHASPEVETYTRAYFHIRIFAAPATLALFGLNGWFLGMQNSIYPMMVTIFLNILNIILNLIFVLGFDMNVSGVALGTVISSYAAVALAWFLFHLKYADSAIPIQKHQLFDPHELAKFFAVNRDIFIRTLCLIFSYAFFISKSAEMGDTILAANTILIQLWHISAYGVDGFAFAAESLVGKYTGAGDGKRLKQAVKTSMRWGIMLGLAASVVYYGLGEWVLRIFTDKQVVLNAAAVVLLWTVFAPVINSICFIWDGVFIGATATGAMRNSMLVATILFFLPVYFFFEPIVGVHAVWLAMTTFMLVRGGTLTLMAPKHIFKTVEQSSIA